MVVYTCRDKRDPTSYYYRSQVGAAMPAMTKDLSKIYLSDYIGDVEGIVSRFPWLEICKAELSHPQPQPLEGEGAS